jgi:hypothetical protein
MSNEVLVVWSVGVHSLLWDTGSPFNRIDTVMEEFGRKVGKMFSAEASQNHHLRTKQLRAALTKWRTMTPSEGCLVLKHLRTAIPEPHS